MQEISIDDIDIGDVIIKNGERYICVESNKCQDPYYSTLRIIKESELLEKYTENELMIQIKNNHDLIFLEYYDFEDEIIYMEDKGKYKNCFTPLILFKIEKENFKNGKTN